MADDDCDGLADAELWAAIDSAAAVRKNSSALAIRNNQVPARLPVQMQQKKFGPLVELPPSPEVAPRGNCANALVPFRDTSRFEMDNRCGQKRHFDDGNESHFRQNKQNNRLVSSDSNRHALQELPNRTMTMVARQQTAGNCWITNGAENMPPPYQQEQVQHQHIQAPTTPWTCSIPSSSVFKQLQDSAMGVLEKGDYMMMHGKPFIKKSGWRKIAFFFNLSFEIRDKKIELDQSANVLRAEFLVRASMQSGRYSDGWGSCDVREKRFSKPNHDIPCTAETRAKTRACQDLVGIGEYKAADTW